MSKNIYMDHAATTAMRKEVVEAMEPYYAMNFENASTSYDKGVQNHEVMENSRRKIARCIGANPHEIFFTSGGSESDNWALKGIAGEQKHKKNHIITTQIEHHAILNSCNFLETLDYEVTYLPVDETGMVNIEKLEQEIKKNTSLISVMYGNNEIGTVEPVQQIGRLARQYGVFFHTDAVQAVGQVPIDVSQLHVDALSASAHKFCGPKGVGFLYVREGVPIPSFIHGGSQEKGKRAGTENLAGIVGMAKALELAVNEMGCNRRYVTFLRDYFIDRVLKTIPQTRVNGSLTRRLPGNISFSFAGVEATMLLVMLEEYGIQASAGSACNTGQTRLSHVIQAIHVPEEYAAGTVRFTIGYDNTMEEMNYVIQALEECVKLLRK